MAGDTGRKIHFLGMFFMTGHAIRNLSVFGMAFVAGHFCVCAGVILDLLALLLVACQTRRADATLKFQIKRGMRVGMATGTLRKLKVGLAAVALAACGNII